MLWLKIMAGIFGVIGTAFLSCWVSYGVCRATGVPVEPFGAMFAYCLSAGTIMAAVLSVCIKR